MAKFCADPTFFLILIIPLFLSISCIQFIHSLSTVSISKVSNQTLVCALLQSSPSLKQSFYFLNCTSFPDGIIRVPVSSSSSATSFSGIVGGNGFVCALISSSSSSIMVCWRFEINGTNMSYKRIYTGPLVNELDSGNSHICGVLDGTNRIQCWQWQEFGSNGNTSISSSLAVGDNFVCGLDKSRQIVCLGSYTLVTDRVPTGNYSLVAAGFRHACAISLNGSLECWGDIVGEKTRGVFTRLALSENRGCALKLDKTVLCWGFGKENNFSFPVSLQDKHFISIEARQDVFCGIVLEDFSLSCWGNEFLELDSNFTVFNHVVPGPCRRQCPCNNPLPSYGAYCDQGLMICEPCILETSMENPPPPPPPPSQRVTNGGDQWNGKMVSFLVVGCFGSVSMVLVICFLFFKYCKNIGSRVHDSGPLDEPMAAAAAPQQQQQQQKVMEKKLSQLISIGNGGSHLEEFSLERLIKATNGFSEEHKIGTGSFGTVYVGTLENGIEVAIKRAEITASSSLYNVYAAGRNQDDNKDSAFLNELEFLSRLNHKNLVRLLGYCEESNERILVYEYMNNGSLHDHLHNHQDSPLLRSSWAAKIKIALDAARGIEYLHKYAVPQVIHRDIKSSNILLDSTWTAKVSDFGLSLTGPPDNNDDKEESLHLSLRAAGTVGYIDPEYYRMEKLTTKSDVYSFGVLLLEMLSGCKAIHKNENGVPRNVVDYVVPYIVKDEIHRILDKRVANPTPFEIEGVAYVGYLAVDCVTLKGRNRPTMTEIVNSLEKALAACLASPNFSRSSTTASVSSTIYA